MPKSAGVAISQELGKLPTKSAAETFDMARKTDKNGKPIRTFVSAGEKIHNEITYRGVDWLLNSAFGVGFTYLTQRTKVGRELWSEPLTGFFTRAFKPLAGNNPTAIEKPVTYGVMFLSIMFGGTITVPPLMYLENPKNKVPIVKRLNAWIYGKDKAENDPKFKQSYEEIKHQPHKDFKTGMITRGLALAPLLAVTLYKPTNRFIRKNFYDHISSGTQFVAEKTGLNKGAYWAKRSLPELPFGMAEAELNKIETLSRDDFMKLKLTDTQREHFGKLSDKNFKAEIDEVKRDTAPNRRFLHDTIAFDFGLTIFYSFLHEVAYKLYAKKKDDKRNAKEAAKHTVATTRPHVTKEETPITAQVGLDTQAAEAPKAQVSQIASRELLSQQDSAIQLN